MAGYFNLMTQLAPNCKKAVAPVVVQGSVEIAVGAGDTPVELTGLVAGDAAANWGTLINEGCTPIIVEVTFLDGDDCDSCTTDTLTTAPEYFLLKGNQGYTLPESFISAVNVVTVDSAALTGDNATDYAGAAAVITANEGNTVSFDSSYAPECASCVVLVA